MISFISRASVYSKTFLHGGRDKQELFDIKAEMKRLCLAEEDYNCQWEALGVGRVIDENGGTGVVAETLILLEPKTSGLHRDFADVCEYLQSLRECVTRGCSILAETV